MTALDVKRRNEFINECLKEEAIEWVMFDGSDSRFRNAVFNGMQQLSGLCFSNRSEDYQIFIKCPGFASNVLDGDFDDQDLPSIPTKFRKKS
jgi:hypothetical protein